ncbi:ECF transporter S component [Candidatus Parcubacteria bacterium]|nr:MAG: ECF transporter S component [Candidatus Parcubacteria bacterium]
MILSSSFFTGYAQNKISIRKKALAVCLFTILSVFLPYVFHQFGAAGRIFLPMQIFILVAALTFGYQTGMIVGLMTPLISYFVSGMPVWAVLPVITLESLIYGLLAGILREKFRLSVVVALLVTAISGRIFLIPLIDGLTGFNGWIYVKEAVIFGWPGIILQLVSVPVLARFAGKIFN